MKRLLLPLIAALALPTAVEANWFGKYNSRYDANEACEIWMLKGFKYTYKVRERKGYSNRRVDEPHIVWERDKNGNNIMSEYSRESVANYLEDLRAVNKETNSIIEKTRTGYSRSCLEERETKQFIGRKKSCLKKKEYSVKEWEKLFELKSCEKRKYFKY